MISFPFIQNPFLYGAFLLRKDQLKMQLDSQAAADSKKTAALKERTLFFPTSFKGLELAVRQNLAAANSVRSGPLGEGRYERETRETGIRLYANAALANEAILGEEKLFQMRCSTSCAFIYQKLVRTTLR